MGVSARRFELLRDYSHCVLNTARLPIAPRTHLRIITFKFCDKNDEALVRFCLVPGLVLALVALNDFELDFLEPVEHGRR